MINEVMIDGRAVPMKSSALTIVRYRTTFNRDLLLDIAALASAKSDGEAVVTIMRLAYTMATQAGETKPFEEWLDDFGPRAFIVSSSAILDQYYGSTETLVTAKKKAE